MFSFGPPHMAEQKQNDQLELTYYSSVRIRDVAPRTCQKRWMIGRSGEKGSGISVLATRHDDDDDDVNYFLFFYANVSDTERLQPCSTIILQGWLWQYIIHEGWFAIKQRNLTTRGRLNNHFLGTWKQCLQKLTVHFCFGKIGFQEIMKSKCLNY